MAQLSQSMKKLARLKSISLVLFWPLSSADSPFVRRQTMPESASKQRTNLDSISFMCSTRLCIPQRRRGRRLTSGVTLFGYISNPASVSSPRCGRVPPPPPDPWSQSFFSIWQPWSPWVSSPRDRPGRGTEEARPGGAALSALLGLRLDLAKDFCVLLWKIETETHINTNKPPRDWQTWTKEKWGSKTGL